MCNANVMNLYPHSRQFGLVTALLLSCAPPVWADAADCITSSLNVEEENREDAPLCSELYPDYLYSSESSPWRVGFGAGYGERSNPLINSDDIPIYGIIQLSWFGENFFFDNGDIGWFITEGDDWSLNAIAGVGGERSFYSYLNRSSIGFSPGLAAEEGLTAGPSDSGSDTKIPEPEAPERDYTFDGGLELLYAWQGSEAQLQLLTDISGRHKGQEAWLSWAYPGRCGRFQWTPAVGFNWKSARAADYYYGVRDDEAQPGLPAYEIESAVINPFARLSLSYSFNKHWEIISVLQYEQLAGDIKDSPAVEDAHVRTAFVGLYYEF